MIISIYISNNESAYHLYTKNLKTFITVSDCFTYPDRDYILEKIEGKVEYLDLQKMNTFNLICYFSDYQTEIAFKIVNKNTNFCITKNRICEFVFDGCLSILHQALLRYNEILLKRG